MPAHLHSAVLGLNKQFIREGARETLAGTQGSDVTSTEASSGHVKGPSRRQLTWVLNPPNNRDLASRHWPEPRGHAKSQHCHPWLYYLSGWGIRTQGWNRGKVFMLLFLLGDTQATLGQCTACQDKGFLLCIRDQDWKAASDRVTVRT